MIVDGTVYVYDAGVRVPADPSTPTPDGVGRYASDDPIALLAEEDLP